MAYWIFDGSIYFAKVNLHRLIDDAGGEAKVRNVSFE